MTSSSNETVTITLRRANIEPAVFIAASFTAPPWQPVELNASKADHNGEVVFTKVFPIPLGRWEYKFRLGQGEHWVCDDQALQTTDEKGVKKNLIIIDPGLIADAVSEADPKKHRIQVTTPLTDQTVDDPPLLSHEQHSPIAADLGPHAGVTRWDSQPFKGNLDRRTSLCAPASTFKDFRDPNLEVFPHGKVGILQRMESLKLELPVDESTDIDRAEDKHMPLGRNLARQLTAGGAL